MSDKAIAFTKGCSPKNERQKTPSFGLVQGGNVVRRDFMALVGKANAILSQNPIEKNVLVEYIGNGIGVIKGLKNFYYQKNALSDIREKRFEIKKLIATLVRHLSSFELDSSDERTKNYAKILGHYRSSELADDKALVEEFDLARQEYQQNPAKSCIRYGWVLYDCLNAALRLCNVKLVEYFLSESAKWRFVGEKRVRDERLEKQLHRTVERAQKFLSGPSEAMAYKSRGEWDNALRAAEAFLKRNPRNELAYSIAFDACDEQKNYSKMLLLCIVAIKNLPDNFNFQYRFVRVIWSLYKTLKNSGAAVAKQSVAGLCALLQTMDEMFPSLGGIAPKTKDYSSLLSAATKIAMCVCAAPLLDMPVADAKSLKEQVVHNYISIVKKWRLENLTDEDKNDRFVNGRRYSSLSANVVLALLKCIAVGNASSIASAEPWIMELAQGSRKLFGKDVSRYLFGLADAYYAMDDKEKSREYAIRLVRNDQSEGWRWRVLARTYPKDSQERGDCLARAMSFEECRSGARFSKMVDAWLDGSIKKFSEVKFSDEEMAAAINERVKAKSIQDSRAEALLIGDATRYKGVILTRFDEVRKKSARGELLDNTTSLRIWWSDENGAAKTDFVAFSAFEDIDAASAGTPVWVLVASDGDRDTIVKVLPRPEARPFDIYPYCVGLVVERNESRHVISVEYAEGKWCPVNIKRMSSKAEFDPGDLCRIALLERSGMTPLFLDIDRAKETDVLPSFAKEFNGIVTREPGSRDAHVGDVIIPAGVYSREMVGAKAYGMAASILAKNGARMWRAVTISITPKNLEVRP